MVGLDKKKIVCKFCNKKVSWYVHHLRIYCENCGREIKDHQIEVGYG